MKASAVAAMSVIMAITAITAMSPASAETPKEKKTAAALKECKAHNSTDETIVKCMISKGEMSPLPRK